MDQELARMALAAEAYLSLCEGFKKLTGRQPTAEELSDQSLRRALGMTPSETPAHRVEPQHDLQPLQEDEGL